ncbi:MAG: 3-phosphoserine/phosphohydroxythreonine transaminase [Pseudomonadales bacterium]|nr:3-phosphoserine/phosphohydroxythreonine transaminase [Pseudomonadales bacterium]
MTRIFNFSPGPAALPEPVLKQAQQELLNFRGLGVSVMEISHRGKEFMDVAEQAEADFRDLLQLPDNYHVFFMQGGASLQFSMVPLNLLGEKSTADYLNTGNWSTAAIKEARRLCDVNVVASSEDTNFDRIPALDTWKLSKDAAYLHITGNETIGGVEFHEYPDLGTTPLVSDMSSTLLSRPLDVEKFGVIYAGAQKNLGPAGMTIVVVRDDLVGLARANTPRLLDYQVYADSGSMANTPPTFAWYLCGLVFKWIKSLGGLTAMAEINSRKAKKLYAAIDESNYFTCPVAEADRSWMNIPFTLADAGRDGEFLELAKARGLLNLKGHRSVGGMRASIYNAVPEAAVDALIEFLREFEKREA